MDKAEWKKSCSALRHVLRHIEGTGNGRTSPIAHKFGVYYLVAPEMWYIWNASSENIIATVKIRRGQVFVRYRKASYYAEILRSRDTVTVAVPSTNLFRRRATIYTSIHRRVMNQMNPVPESPVQPRTSAFVGTEAIEMTPQWVLDNSEMSYIPF